MSTARAQGQQETDRASRVLLIGQAPGPGGSAGTPLAGQVGRRLAALAGMTFEAFAARTDRTNILQRWPGPRPGGKGDAFPVREARQEAQRLLPLLTGRRTIFIGRATARAFGAGDLPPFAWHRLREDVTAAWVYHPSGVCRWYNDPENRARAAEFLRQALA